VASLKNSNVHTKNKEIKILRRGSLKTVMGTQLCIVTANLLMHHTTENNVPIIKAPEVYGDYCLNVDNMYIYNMENNISIILGPEAYVGYGWGIYIGLGHNILTPANQLLVLGQIIWSLFN
jgi:hypothetical protein